MYWSNDNVEPGASRPAAHPTLAGDIRLVTRVFTHRWRLIGLSLGTALVLGVGYLWFSPPKFESTVELLVDPRPRQVVDSETVPTGLGSSSMGADTALVESQVDIITSRSVFGALIDRFGLVNDPEFGDGTADGPSFVSGIFKALIYGPNSASQASQSPEDKAMEKLAQSVKVGRAGNTYILQITAKTGSAQKSADIANGVAAIYLEQIQGAASSASAESADFLEARLGELKAAADTAQKAVEDYRSANGLISADSLPIGEQQLRDITAQITAASIASEAARADLEETKRLADTPLAGGASALSSTAIDALRLQLEVARGEERALGASLGPKHPSMVKARESRSGIEAALNAEYSRLVAQADSQYQAALAKEQSLRGMLGQYEAKQASANAASVTLAELQRVASSKTAVYETYLSRALQVREQVTSPASTARTISPAVVSSRPSEPKPALVLGLAGVAGLAIGFAISWLQHLFAGTPVRTIRAARPRRAPAAPRQPSPERPVAPGLTPATAQPATAATQTRPKLSGLFR